MSAEVIAFRQRTTGAGRRQTAPALLALLVALATAACAHRSAPASGDFDSASFLEEGHKLDEQQARAAEEQPALVDDTNTPTGAERERALDEATMLAALKQRSGPTPGGADLSPEIDPASKDRLRLVKLDHMGRTEVHVRSAVEDEDALGGFAVFGATQQPLAESIDGDSDQAIRLVVGHERSVPYGNGFNGITLIIANVSDAQIALSASDSRIRVVQEALDEDGQWRPIEVLPSSWCGNSYHTVYLRPGHAWHVAAPRYGGALKTQLRFRLSRGEAGDVVSNTFPGAINVERFTTKKARQPQGIMDPYND